MSKDDALAVGPAPAKKDGRLPVLRTGRSADERFAVVEIQLDKLQSKVESLIDERAGIKAMLH